MLANSIHILRQRPDLYMDGIVLVRIPILCMMTEMGEQLFTLSVKVRQHFIGGCDDFRETILWLQVI